MSVRYKKIVIFTLFLLASLMVADFALAQSPDLGLSYGEELGLANGDPRIAAANVIRIALTFIGIIAVIVILYGGFLWMTAAGNPEKINKAKKVLIGAIIGLIIILSAFLITTFIINRISGALGPACEPPCLPGEKCCSGNYCCPDTYQCCNKAGNECCDTGAGECCCWDGCRACPCGTPPVSTFYISSRVPDDGAIVVRNVKIRFTFNTSVDSGTVDNTTFRVEDGGAPVAGTRTVNGRRIEFIPDALCPPNPCDATNCFDPGRDITVTAVSGAGGILSIGGLTLTCNIANPCTITFTTNDQIDCQDPSVTLHSSAQVCLDTINDLGFQASDDSGVALVELNDDNGGAAFLGGPPPITVPCPGPGPCGQLPGSWLEPLGTVQWQPTAPAYSAGTNYAITATAEDLDANTDSDSQTFKLRPAHCCNGVMDGDETGIDCGGSCAGCRGAACGISLFGSCASDPDPNCDDNRCATGFCHCGNYPDGPLPNDSCQEKGYDMAVGDTCCVCELKPIIDWVTPMGGFCDGSVNTPCQDNSDCAAFTPDTCNTDTPNGAVGNFVTIGGRNFGDTPGTVYFSNAAGNPTVVAVLANDPAQGNPVCGLDSEMWTDKQIIVVVPAGVNNGPVRVEEAVTGNNFYDDSANNFLVNTIERPGLCMLTPDFGVMEDPITYQGIRLNGATAYFGNLKNYVVAINSNFPINTQGNAQVPNINTGRTTSFVLNPAGTGSNYLRFRKDPEAVLGPYINSYEPAAGAPGQYVTIYGGGFRHTKGTSQVLFEVTEANYDFPEVCADSVWSDNQIIVKVPAMGDGNYPIIIDLGTETISTDDFSLPQFTVNNSLPLAPSLCKIQPIMGPNNSPVSLWGEYFGNEATGLVRFHLNHDQVGGTWGTEDDADKIETTVHQQAVTGPVRVVQSGLAGNGLNFRVGSCTQDADCGAGNVCCPVGTFEQGRCHASLDDCYIEIEASVYEWDFSTLAGLPCDGDPETALCDADHDFCQANGYDFCDVNSNCTCQNGVECDANDLTPVCDPDDALCLGLGFDFCNPIIGCFCDNNPVQESCMGYGQGECAANFCPNSPGQCSPYDGSLPQVVGSCSDSDCEGIGACTVPPCTYNSNLNRCISGVVCSAAEIRQDVLGNDVLAYCADYSGAGRWHMDTSLSCPAGWSSIGGDRCIEDSTTCTLCASGFTCFDDGGGVCAVNQNICPAGSSCQVGECIRDGQAVCECCCRIGFVSEDCCVPLDCTGACGDDRVTPTNTYGYCTGCANAGATQVEHDAACNCFGHSGKFCDNSDPQYPDGVCRDCTQLSTSGECGLHNTVCCIDAENSDACRGGDGTLVPAFPGYCAYYDCQLPPNEDQCDSANPAISGTYRNLVSCVADCASSGPVGPQGGRSCFSGIDNACTIVCGSSYACLGDDGCEDNIGPWPAGCGPSNIHDCRCCCDPTNDQCSTINPEYPDLVCQPDQSPCIGSERGLCCGCEEDSHCGNSLNIGCGNDTCCHARPGVTLVTPSDEETDICRNAVITAEFDQEMNLGSFSGNVIVVGDYSTSPCPAGTEYLARSYKIKDHDNIFVRIFSRIAQAVVKLIRPALPAQLAKAYTPPGNNNYCAIRGSVSGYNNAANHGVLEFRLNSALDPNRLYYVIVKGDSNLGDEISEGVENYWGITMNGPADSNNVFNGITYNNSYIWSFTTGNDICQIAKITVNPASYLFTAPNETQDFVAEPMASDGQIITAIAGVYNWAWSWNSDNERVAIVTDSDNPQQTVTSQNVKDGRTYIKARATIIEDTVMSPSTVDQFKVGQAQVYVFLCTNPWPPRNPDGTWNPWSDTNANCTVPLSGCHNTNYEIYYCRDDRGVGTADDLPAILSDNTIIRGDSGDIFKEAYYFRESIPSGTTSGLTATNTPGVIDGGSIDLSWGAVADAIGYKLYWGTASGNYSDFQDVGNVTSYTIAGLTNGITYYFNFTSYASGMAETDYYGEVEIIPADTTAPSPPTNFVAIAGDGEVELSWDEVTGAASHEVLYGTTLGGPYGYSENIGSDTAVIIAGLTNGQTYHFAVKAVDAADNKSAAATQNNIIPFSAPTNLIAMASSTNNTVVDLSWSLVGEGVSQVNAHWGVTSGTYPSVSPNLPGDSITYAVTSLVPNTTYYFIVRSTNGTDSQSSNEASAKTYP